MGSLAGTASSRHLALRALRLVLAIVLALVSLQMLLRDFGKGLP